MNTLSVTNPARQTPVRYITVAEAVQMWSDVRASVPLGTDKMKHGTVCMANYWTGSFTQTQLDEFNRRVQKLIRAGKKAAKAAA